MGSGEISASEHSAVHPNPTQIEPREISPGQIDRSEIRAAALVPFRLQVQLVVRQHLFDLIWR
jgi:hypothetical protein